MSTNYIRPDVYPYASRRSEVFAENMVASSQPLAVAAGIQMLREGGNAVDAALACAIALTVIEPASNSIGGDAFAIIYADGKLHGFNGSGKSPQAWTPERFAGLDEIPQRGWEAITVPGAVDTWMQLSSKFGRLEFLTLFEPAIHYARHGFPVAPVMHRQWQDAIASHGDLQGFRDTFTLNGSAPDLGQKFCCPDQANTFEKIASSAGESFYRGELAEKIIADSDRHNGAMTLQDLASHKGQFVQPISQQYRNLSVHEIPPGGQGIGALIALGILDRLEIEKFQPDSLDSLHIQIEAVKIALEDLARHISDPATMQISPQELLSSDRLDRLAAEIDPHNARQVNITYESDHGTVYLATADSEGMMVSMIQSNYDGFGSGIVVPETGINMQNRGRGFNLIPGHPNQVAGGKYPFHTIIPGFLMQGGEPLGPFGIMGAHIQTQAQTQFVIRVSSFGQSPQAALDAPRWFISPDFKLATEPGISNKIVEGLQSKGHLFDQEISWSKFGGGQAIFKHGNVYRGASDPRKDGLAMGF
ncbi:MAG: gamma-glutamyltranspeptidase/glutathione hydrolase [Parasphingorhabdus sp.]|jgi:gamma-glutamyltranspeptidase/glutathione hydrolase